MIDEFGQQVPLQVPKSTGVMFKIYLFLKWSMSWPVLIGFRYEMKSINADVNGK